MRWNRDATPSELNGNARPTLVCNTLIHALKGILEDPAFPEGTAWRRSTFETNDTIVREQEEGRSIFLIEAGRLRVSGRVRLEDSRRIQPGICDLGPGDLFGELCLFSAHARSASVTAISDGRLVEIDGGALSLYLDNHPELGYLFLREMFTTLTHRLGRANLRIESLLAWGLKAHGIDRYL